MRLTRTNESLLCAGDSASGAVYGPSILYVLLKCKAMSHATLSVKNQIVIPRDAREALGVKAGDRLLVVVRGDKVIILQKPKAHHSALRGLTGEYPAGYLKKERDSWA